MPRVGGGSLETTDPRDQGSEEDHCERRGNPSEELARDPYTSRSACRNISAFCRESGWTRGTPRRDNAKFQEHPLVDPQLPHT